MDVRISTVWFAVAQRELAQYFFNKAFSTANCPQKRSNSAIFASADGSVSRKNAEHFQI
ncbi:hypothetical protein KSC_057790 [Ktedonobacter sp. SOSP1-52]|nr:hypothetical protein KSC_057790 [Ktedonobacter sp. SOSP1-52]